MSTSDLEGILPLIHREPQKAVLALNDLRTKAIGNADTELAFQAMGVQRVALGVAGDGEGELVAILECASERPTSENILWVAYALHARGAWSAASAAYEAARDATNDKGLEPYVEVNEARCVQHMMLTPPPGTVETPPEQALYDLGCALEEMGERDAARRAFVSAIYSNPSSELATNALWMLARAASQLAALS